MDALRLPPGDADVTKLSGGERRRVALCRLLLEQPDMLLLDEPTNHLDAESVGWLERYLAEFPGTVVAITHDRYFLDNVAEWILELDRGAGIPVGGELLVAGSSRRSSASAQEEKQASRPAEDAAARARVGAHVAARAAGEEQGAHQKLRGAARGGRAADEGAAHEIIIPRPAAARQRRRDREGRLKKAYGDKLLFEDLDLLAAARRHRRRDRAERRGQDDAVPHDRRPGAARRRRAEGRRDGAARLRRSEPRRARPAEDRVSGNQRRAGRDPGRQAARSTRGPTCRGSTSAAPISRRRWATSRAASATGCTWPSC